MRTLLDFIKEMDEGDGIMKEITYKYGAVYWRYGSKGWTDGTTLEEVVNHIGYRSDDGELSYNAEDFYELTDDGWVSIDEEIIKDLFDKRDARESAKYKAYSQSKQSTPWQIRVRYPQGVEQIWDRYVTRELAEEELKEIDPRLNPYIVKFGEKDQW